MIRQIQHILVEIVHTKEGLHVALQCLWHSTAKERKAIAKSFKPFVNKIATDDQGHKVCIDLKIITDLSSCSIMIIILMIIFLKL